MAFCLKKYINQFKPVLDLPYLIGFYEGLEVSFLWLSSLNICLLFPGLALGAIPCYFQTMVDNLKSIFFADPGADILEPFFNKFHYLAALHTP